MQTCTVLLYCMILLFEKANITNVLFQLTATQFFSVIYMQYTLLMCVFTYFFRFYNCFIIKMFTDSDRSYVTCAYLVLYKIFMCTVNSYCHKYNIIVTLFLKVIIILFRITGTHVPCILILTKCFNRTVKCSEP